MKEQKPKGNKTISEVDAIDPGAVVVLAEKAYFDNAVVGEGTIIEPHVTIGLRYHKACGPARIGKHGILRRGTIIYGDVSIGDYFQSNHYSVIRAKVRMGNYCTILNHSTLEGIIHMGDGVRIMSHTYVPSRTWFGDHVFVGPGVTFLNDRFPGREDPMPTPRGATIENDVVLDRQKLAEDGIVNVVAQISQSNQKIVGKPVVTSHGLVPDKDDKKFAKEIEVLLEPMLLNMKAEALKNHRDIENDIRAVVRKHVVRTKKRYPLIIPTIYIV